MGIILHVHRRVLGMVDIERLVRTLASSIVREINATQGKGRGTRGIDGRGGRHIREGRRLRVLLIRTRFDAACTCPATGVSEDDLYCAPVTAELQKVEIAQFKMPRAEAEVIPYHILLRRLPIN